MARKLKTITLGQLDGFEIDDENQLYWQGTKVRTRITLPDWAAYAAVAAAGATVVQALLALADHALKWGWV